jgi:hypothetical protein
LELRSTISVSFIYRGFIPYFATAVNGCQWSSVRFLFYGHKQKQSVIGRFDPLFGLVYAGPRAPYMSNKYVIFLIFEW